MNLELAGDANLITPQTPKQVRDKHPQQKLLRAEIPTPMNSKVQPGHSSPCHCHHNPSPGRSPPTPPEGRPLLREPSPVLLDTQMCPQSTPSPIWAQTLALGHLHRRRHHSPSRPGCHLSHLCHPTEVSQNKPLLLYPFRSVFP